MTPTEAAAIAAFYGLIVGLFLYKEMDFKCLINSCIESCETSAVIIVLMAMATLFGNIMTIEDVPGTVARAILSFSENKIVILMLINVLLLIVGTFMEALAAIVILVPILLPIVTGVGVSPALRRHHCGQPCHRLHHAARGCKPLRGQRRRQGEAREHRQSGSAHDRPDAYRPAHLYLYP